MQAVILAAGMGKRLGKYTADGTKCLVKINGKSLIEYAIESLFAAGIKRIVIVVGYKASGLIDFLNEKFPGVQIEFIANPIYDTTNNIYSLWLARDILKSDDTILLESDVIFESSMLEELLSSPEPNLAVVSKFESWMDGTVTLLDENDTIISVIEKKHFCWSDIGKYYKTVNIYKFSKEFSIKYYLPFMEAYLAAFGLNEYYEQVLKVLAYLEHSGLKGFRVSGSRWYEIDDPHDLHVAETIFGDKIHRLDLMHRRYGGFWRFPGLLDYCYLVNPYFPSSRMWEELGSGMRDVVSQYPSGMSVQSLLAGKIFNLSSEMLAVGNGAAELISSLFRITEGAVGIIDPCFNEYPARAGESRVVRYDTGPSNFTYTAKCLVDYWRGKVQWAVLVNPDNPSGHFMNHEDVMSFVDMCKDAGIRPIIDESFVDFADVDVKFTLFDESYLNAHPEVVLIRSISKSYGVPGLRLGVIASSDTALISCVKTDVSVWNINSLGEYFLQVFDKYKKEYHAACEKIAKERNRLSRELEKVRTIKVFPSQANYLLCQFSGKYSSLEIAEKLYFKNAILVKSLNEKRGIPDGEFIRVAIRTTAENDRLVAGLLSI